MNSLIQDYRKEITARIMEAVKAGTAPWQKPWDGSGAPCNAISSRQYNGINAVTLAMHGLKIDEGRAPRWATFLQAKQQGWTIKKGAKGTRVILWKPFEARPKEDDENAEPKQIFLQRVFTVFHASQIDGINEYQPPVKNEIELCADAERIIFASGAEIHYGGDRACYFPGKDFIQLPERERFYSSAGYYSTALHELIHWTGHASRLNRRQNTDKHSSEYAFEELIAEIGSMFISATTGIPQTEGNFQNDAGYVSSWLERMRDDPNLIFRAAAEASKAADFLLGAGRKGEISNV